MKDVGRLHALPYLTPYHYTKYLHAAATSPGSLLPIYHPIKMLIILYLYYTADQFHPVFLRDLAAGPLRRQTFPAQGTDFNNAAGVDDCAPPAPIRPSAAR
jgi:hypothetical protein